MALSSPNKPCHPTSLVVQHRRFINRTRRGVSLLISLILIGILVLFSLGVSNLVVSSIRESANVNQANQAYYAAEGGLEKGLLENAKVGTAGYSKNLDNVVFTGDAGAVPGTPGVVASTVKIQGKSPGNLRIPPNTGEFVVPTPGTGSAGKGCDQLNPNVTDATGLDDACNWNKIMVGETVGVPLYATDTDGSILNPVDLELTSLKVKVRTPCEKDADGHLNCSYSARYTFNETTDGDPVLRCSSTKTVGCGDTIVSWQIVGADVAGSTSYAMGPYDALDSVYSNDRRLKKNTEIYEKLIDDVKATGNISPWFSCGSPYCVLYAANSASRWGKEIQTVTPGPLYDFLMNIDYFVRSSTPTDKTIQKPVLKLTVINSLKNGSDETIPYLEYQVTSNVGIGDKSPADSAQTIISEGFSGPFKQVLEVRQPQETGLLEYVIQQ